MIRPFIVICLLMNTFFAAAQKPADPFAKQWKQVDSLVKKQDLSRSALTIVNEIYKQSKAKQLHVQTIKALLYRLNLEQRFTESDINKKIQSLKDEINGTQDMATRGILSSLLAASYQNYLQGNRWNLLSRSKTVSFKREDVATWNADDFHEAITAWYQQSLQQPVILQKEKIGQYNAILTEYNTKAERPSLYDLLAHRALSYFKSDETVIAKPLYAFVLNDSLALAPIEPFIQHSFITRDTASNKWKALLLFQQLVRYHLQQKDTAAVINVNLERIQFARNNGTIANQDTLYFKAVHETAKRFKKNRYAAQAWYLLASWHAQKAEQYNAQSDTAFQYEYLKALEICNKFLPLTDSTEGTINLFNLYHTITSRQLSISTEQVNTPGQPFRTLVSYKNMQRLYYRIIKINKALEDSIDQIVQNSGYNAFMQIIPQLNYQTTRQVDLPFLGDYQQHSAEVKIDPLNTGKYYLLGSSSPEFADTSRLAVTTFYVSNISYVNNGPNYFVLNRTTGKPLVNAVVKIFEREYSNKTRRYDYGPKESYATNANGYFKLTLKKDNNRNIALQIKHNGDELFIENDQYIAPLSYSRNNYNEDDYEKGDEEEFEEDHAKAWYFRDRSIYRPGQVVNFKLLALTTDLKTKKTKLFTHLGASDKEYVYLQDANNKYIDSALITLNEYGSFTGSFKLPANLLTGEFSLTTLFFDEERNGGFSVEEYKRPTFYVELQKPKGSYKLFDTLTITGTASAYAGTTIDGATVKYRVTRKGRFLYPWLWHRGIRPQASEAAITFGEATTDASGKFTVKFAALPDETLSKKSLPIFDYEINADITDRAGETRSESITIPAAYHSLNLRLNISNTAEADSLKSFMVSTENIAGDKEPAIVKVSIYPLQLPAGLIRKRYWQQPDQFIYSEEEYRNFFPNDEYKNESDKANWQKGAAVFSTTIDTKETGIGAIPEGKLTPGWYQVQAITADKDGNEIKSEQYVHLYSRNSGRFNGSDYLFTSLINNVTAPGKDAAFLLGTNADEVFVIQEIQHQPKEKSTQIQSDFSFFTFGKMVRQITVVPGADDLGGMGVNIVFVRHNRMYTYTHQIQVEDEKEQLDIQVKTYRDKIEPGSIEKWTIQLSGKNKEAVAAEVLTSMYDASLDQFKPHHWQTPLDYPNRFYVNGWDMNNGFNEARSRENPLAIPHKNYWKLYADIDIYRYAPSSTMQMRSGMLEGRAAGMQADGLLEDVVVTALGVRKKNLTAAAITLRGAATANGANAPLYIVDGKIVPSIEDINQDDIADMEVLKDAAATALYGANGANGVILITTKNTKKKDEQPVKIRTNFNETAFFYPQLVTDNEGSLSFSFTLPDALTQWKWQMFAHNKAAVFGLAQKTIISQKTLMIQANAPRFMRQGDQMKFSAKISNLSDKALNGKATLKLINAITMEPADVVFNNNDAVTNFTVQANQSTSVQFSITVPANFTHPLTWQVIAKANGFTDGEENTLPVLSNRMLVTESLPLFVKGDTTRSYEFTKLLKQQSTTLQNQSVTVEYTTNPVWYAVQSLPYLAQYPYECAEQVFNRFFANALASFIAGSNPKIKQVFDAWKKDSAALKSNLEKNEELKNILLQETPWVLQAENEEQQKKNIALLFDEQQLNEAYETSVEKLKQQQMASGGFAWFKGGYEDRYITQYIVAGIGRLQHLKAMPASQKDALQEIANRALQFLDELIAEDYKSLQKYKADLTKNNTGSLQLYYLYTRSYFGNEVPKNTADAYSYYYQQAKKFWVSRSIYFKAMTGQILARNKDADFAKKNILPAILENAVIGNHMGMYWKENDRGYYWYQAPIEQQALMIEFIGGLQQLSLVPQVDEMKTWLLRQKQTSHWGTTKATADACYALLVNGSNWVAADKKVSVTLGNFSIESDSQPQQAGSGYFKTIIPAKDVTSSMGSITVATSSSGKPPAGKMPSWGAVYWQYFEDVDKITSAETPLAISKKLFVEKNTDRGQVLSPVNNGDSLQVGDKVKIQVIIKVDRSMEYVHLKDMRAAAMEPVNVLSGYKFQDGLGYYESTRDAATNFFIGNLPKGTYVFEYPVTITHSGNYSVGIATAQCMYAPEFNSHSEGIRVVVSERN